MEKADWLALAPSLMVSLVTLAVAFGVWKLTAGAERDRERERVEREERNRRAEAYSSLYASFYAWPNVARAAFTDPTDRKAVSAYEQAMYDVSVDYARVLMLGTLELVVEIQEPMGEAIDALDGVMASRQTDGSVLPFDDAVDHPHGAAFLKGKELAIDARSLLLALARKDLGLPGEWVKSP